jgi:ribonuclease HI
MSILYIATNAATVGSNPRSVRPGWKKPDVRQTKINVDGSYHIDMYAGSAGAIIRDHDGRFIGASTLYLPNIASAAAAEAMAMREGLALATCLGCNNIIMESDSVETVEACTGAQTWWGESAAIFADYVDLAALIDQVSFKDCPREANEVAHELANNCFSTKSSCNWVDEPPSFIICKLINDVTIL